MAEKYEKVLELMKSKGGKIDVADPDLNALLGRLMYRVSVYMSFIRRFAKLEVKAIRVGRKVTAYELVNTSPVGTDVPLFQNSKYLKASDVQASTTTPAAVS